MVNSIRTNVASVGEHPLRQLCVIGPMIGRRPNQITTQGEILADLFAAAGHTVHGASSLPSRAGRLLDIVSTLIRRRDSEDIVVLQVYAELSFVVEDVASRLAKTFGRPLVMVLRGGTLPEFMQRFPRWSRAVLGRADALVTPSPFLARAITPYGFTAVVISNVIDIERYPYRPRRELRPRLLWMRTFYDYYNPLMAIHVLARVRHACPGATLVMAGKDKGMQTDAIKLAGDLGLRDAVRFPGFLDLPGKQREGGEADIFLNTNSIDNMPVSVIEACAMGLPVVATDVGGIRDMLTDGGNALLVRDNDVDGMAVAVLRLLNEPDLAARLSNNGRRLAEQFSWRVVRPQWERLFDQFGSPVWVDRASAPGAAAVDPSY